MKILLKSATIVDPNSKHHLKKRDLLIEKGTITKIASNINEENAKTISLSNLYISPGWFDSSVSFGEPGFEERETLEHGIQTAAISGFTAVAVNSNTHPIIDTKSDIKFIKSKVQNSAVDLYPIGALTQMSKGEDLAELFDMHNEGAISFYDYQKPLKNANLLKLALQYVQNFNGLVQSFPLETSVARNGVANEEVNATKLGLKGIPALSEELQIARDLYILEYAGGRLHIPTISTAQSVKLIKEAKKKGLNVSCSVSINHLYLTDEVLDGFDTNYKLMPPLRTEKDRKALLKGLKDGVIDGVTSDHNPIDIENKRSEFDLAMFGSIGLESCFAALLKVTDLETAVRALTGLKNTFGLENTTIDEGSKATLSLFNPEIDWTFKESDIHSTSKNAALLGKPLKGRVYGILNNHKLLING